jgi:hypothetical protein
LSQPKEPRYLALTPGQYGIGETIQGRVYKSAVHAQLVNPTGTLYVLEGEGEAYHTKDGDPLHTLVAKFDAYPLTLYETRVPASMVGAEGAYVLRDFGPRAHDRWVTHFRNDQLGGYSGGGYFNSFPEALAAYAERAARELRLQVARLQPEPAEA